MSSGFDLGILKCIYTGIDLPTRHRIYVDERLLRKTMRMYYSVVKQAPYLEPEQV